MRRIRCIEVAKYSPMILFVFTGTSELGNSLTGIFWNAIAFNINRLRVLILSSVHFIHFCLTDFMVWSVIRYGCHYLLRVIMYIHWFLATNSRHIMSTVKSLINHPPNPKTQTLLVSACSCLCAIYWSQVLNREWRCSWNSAERRCSNYIWDIKI